MRQTCLGRGLLGRLHLLFDIVRRATWYRHGRSQRSYIDRGDEPRGKTADGVNHRNQGRAPFCSLCRGYLVKLHVTFEEGTWAAWLFDLLKPHVTKLVVCDPRKNALLKTKCGVTDSDFLGDRRDLVPLASQ
jgi:hypothetical protein